MLRFRPQSLLHRSVHVRPFIHLQIRAYVTKRAPDPSSVNYPLLNKLYDEYQVYSSGPDPSTFKLKALGTAMSAIENLPFKVQRMQDVENVPGIGAGIKRRIEEYLVTEEEHGKIPSTSRNVQTKKELLQAVKEFQTVSGVGPKKARRWADQGFRTLDDVINDTEGFNKLPKGIKTALRYSSNIVERILREDIDKLSAEISAKLKDFEVHVAGSYRRGALSSSDMDVILFHPEFTDIPPSGPKPTGKKAQAKAREESLLLNTAVPLLSKAGILGEELTSGPMKWQGLAKLPGSKNKFCRIDLNFMPTSCRGAALVGFTGDAEFNKHLRGKANRFGRKLNEFGLWKRPKDWKPSEKTDTKDDTEWELIPTITEEDIFNELDEGWVDPLKRNFNNLVGKRNRTLKE